MQKGEIALTLTFISGFLILTGIFAGILTLRQSTNTKTSALSNCDINPSISGRTQINSNHILCSGNYSKGIDIVTNNITLDCNSVIIDGSKSQGTNPGIAVKASNIIVKNCIVKGFFNGLEAIGPNITGLDIEGGDYSYNSANTQAPPDGALSNWMDKNTTGGGIYFQNINSSKINLSAAHGNIAGITLMQSQNIEVSGGDYSANSGWGIRMITTTDSNIHDTTANNNNRCLSTQGGCESAAILLINSSNNNTITNNQLNNSGDGFYINGCGHPSSNNNQITGNTANADTNNKSGNGFEATFSTGNIFNKNTTSGKNYGFWLGYSDSSTLSNNSAAGNLAGINIPNSINNILCANSIQNNSENSKLWIGTDDCGTGKSKDCHDNTLSSNNPKIDDTACRNEKASPLPPQCNTTVPSPTPNINSSPTPNNTPPSPTSPGITAPPPPSGSLPPLNQSGSVTIETHEGTISGPLWTSQGTYSEDYANTNNLIVYLTGPDKASGGFGESLIIPGTISGNTNCKGNICTCLSNGDFFYECSPGTLTWKGAYTNANLPGGNVGTMLGTYQVKIVQSPPSWTNDNSVVSGTLKQVGTNLKLKLVLNQATTTSKISPSPGPSPASSSAPLSYTNKDYEIVIGRYAAEQISPLTVSQWLSAATRYPGLQTAICYPPNCDFVQ